jgi:hypothetical protein
MDRDRATQNDRPLLIVVPHKQPAGIIQIEWQQPVRTDGLTRAVCPHHHKMTCHKFRTTISP